MDVSKLQEFLESEEGQRSMDKWAMDLANKQEHLKRWVEKFKKWAEPNIDAALEILITKYDSSEYIDREYKIGYEPREEFLWLAFEYARLYCKPCEDEKYFNMFTGEAYYIGSYVIQVMHGQGSVIRIDKIQN